jgi:hypothetical protein
LFETRWFDSSTGPEKGASIRIYWAIRINNIIQYDWNKKNNFENIQRYHLSYQINKKKQYKLKIKIPVRRGACRDKNVLKRNRQRPKYFFYFLNKRSGALGLFRAPLLLFINATSVINLNKTTASTIFFDQFKVENYLICIPKVFYGRESSQKAWFQFVTRWQHINFRSNWLGGTLSGQKRPIFRHTSQIFLTVALLRPTKIRFVWQKTATFLSQTRPR